MSNASHMLYDGSYRTTDGHSRRYSGCLHRASPACDTGVGKAGARSSINCAQSALILIENFCLRRFPPAAVTW